MGKNLIRSQMVIITGMSGAGKTVAIQTFEDLGYYCVDNLPPILMPKFVELMKDSPNQMGHVALVMDLRGREFFDEIVQVLEDLVAKDWVDISLLFLDADDATLVNRYKETRRVHPLAPAGLPLKGIQQERKLLGELKGKSQKIINTSGVSPKELREKILTIYSKDQSDSFSVHFVSFGYKHGIPLDADIVLDVRFLPNPHYIESMKEKTGLDEDVSQYVLKWSESKRFVKKTIDLLRMLLPYYRREGKSQLIVAIGCTGGQHRSVAISEVLVKEFQDNNRTMVTHRDVKKKRDT
jgi:UPF0042 nucleotide-binding protein